MLENAKCQDCQSWVDRGGQIGVKLGWCVSEKIARNFEEFPDTGVMCQCENVRTQMDDTYIITARNFGCVNFKPKS